MKRIALIGAALTLLAAGGCRHKVGSEGTYELNTNAIKSADLPAAKSLAVEFASKDSVPIDVALVRREDADAALEAVNNSKKTPQEAFAAAKKLASREKTASGTINAPKSDKPVEYSLLLVTEKATTVTVKTKGE